MTNRADTPEYRKAYARGWRASAAGGDNGALERADSRGESTAWYDGYADMAAGRERLHLLFCTDHDKC